MPDFFVNGDVLLGLGGGVGSSSGPGQGSESVCDEYTSWESQGTSVSINAQPRSLALLIFDISIIPPLPCCVKRLLQIST